MNLARRLHAYRFVAGAMLFAAALLVPSAPALAATPCGGAGVLSLSGATATCTYTTTGSHDFTVPSYVSDVTITEVGGEGGSGEDRQPGGFGDSALGTYAVNPDDVLSVAVAGNGTAPNPGSGAGGFGGGGTGGPAAYGGSGGGGGASSVSDGPTTLLVAAGGGGAGWGGAGGDAGQPGFGCSGGGAASGATGGSAGQGSLCGGGDGTVGLLGSGGTGGGAASASSGGGGGGGGGYAGGGGGAGGAGTGSGGGGGSSYSSGPNATFAADTTGVPAVAISWTLASPGISTSRQPAAATVGSSIADKAAVSGGYSPTGTVTFSLYNNSTALGTPLFTDTETLSAGVATSKGYTTTAGGTDYWVAAYNGDSNNSSVTSTADGEPVTITLAPTSLTAWPQLVIFEPFAGVGNQVVQATLTTGGSPLAGQTIWFSDGSTQLCNAVTNNKGVARCRVSGLDQLLLNRNNHYTATFAATSAYSESSSTVPAITFFW